MSRFVFSTCGVLAEVVSFDIAAPPLIIGLATLSLIVGALSWSTEFSRLIDRIVGLDLQHPDAPKHYTETD